MLEKVDVDKNLTKDEYKKFMEDLTPKLSYLQRKCKELNIPVLIVFEGWGASGKGTLINKLIAPLDPRGFKVYTIHQETEEEKMRPFLWRFWIKTPAAGRMVIFDRSWYKKVLGDRMDGWTSESDTSKAFEEITDFESQLTAEGTVIIKYFLHISKKEQKKRFDKLSSSKETAWRVTKSDWKHYEDYEKYLKINNEMLEKTDTGFAPWTIIEAQDREFAAVKILSTAVERLEEAVEKYEQRKCTLEYLPKETKTDQIKEDITILKSGVLSHVDMDKTLTKEEYKKKLKKLQERLSLLHNEIYLNRIPVVLAFEGWDAAGKGGAIKRLTEYLDPRGYEVVTTAAPNDLEKAHHYLWRFWNSIPKAGHLAIFDRTWYGRVLVERVEGFCTEEEWQRAYNELNHMEEQLVNAESVVIKFWLQIDKEEQEKRFKERQENPEKQWKITEEDWRNRSKWDEYENAVNEMIVRTSTTYAPWVIVEANSKYYARIKVLETVMHALEEKLKEGKKTRKEEK